ncbi:hypothetical protein RKD27_003068 [Streptomyces sp. SAI-126]
MASDVPTPSTRHALGLPRPASPKQPPHSALKNHLHELIKVGRVPVKLVPLGRRRHPVIALSLVRLLEDT